MSTIGERIKEVRLINKLTQQEFGNSLGVSRPHISKIESGKENASDSVIRLICKTYNVEYAWIKSGSISDTINIDAEKFMKDVNRTHELSLGHATNKLITVLNNNKIKNNSQKQFVNNIESILETIQRFFDRPDIEKCDSQDINIIMSHIEKKMNDALQSFKTENLDKKLK